MTVSAPLLALRAATQEIHESLEGRLIIAKADAGADAYRRYLEALWGWLAPFEASLWAAPWPDAVTPARRDGKRSWIARDLAELGVDSTQRAALPRSAPVPLDSLGARFGVAYVVEGSQLGGQVMARRLGPALQPLVPRYLIGYGDETGALWRSFVGALGALDDASTVIAAASARASFVDLREWFVERGVA